MKNQFNFYQRITLILYLISLSIITLIFVPFRKYNIHYDFLWSNHDKLDLYRLIIEILFISITAFIVFKLTSNLKDPVFKFKKNRLLFFLNSLIFVSYIISIVITNNYLYEKNIGYEYLIKDFDMISPYFITYTLLALSLFILLNNTKVKKML